MPLSREEDILRNTSILHFYLKITSPWGGVMIYNSCLLTLQMLHIKFGYDWPSSSGEEVVNARRTMDDRRQQTPTHRWPKILFATFWSSIQFLNWPSESGKKDFFKKKNLNVIFRDRNYFFMENGVAISELNWISI